MFHALLAMSANYITVHLHNYTFKKQYVFLDLVLWHLERAT